MTFSEMIQKLRGIIRRIKREPENKSSALDFLESVGEFLFGLTLISLIITGPSILAWVIFTFGLSLSPEFAIELTVLVSAVWFTYLLIYILYNTRGGGR